MREDAEALDDAWKIHAALVDWTGKVDTKAAFALTLQSAVVAGIITLSSPGRRFDNLTGFRLTSFWFSVVFLIVGLLSALLVTVPRLRAQKLKAEKSDNWIYFGHLRHWEGKDLQDALLNSDPLPVVCRQLVHMSKIAWVKHRRVQLSFVSAALAGVCLVLAAISR